METFEGQNWASLKTVRVIEKSKVGFSESQNPIDFSSISIQSGSEIEEIPHILESAGFQETEKITDAGTSFDKKVQLSIPKLRSEVSTLLNKYENRKLVLLVTDFNDVSHLVYPVRMLRQRNIPAPVAGLNATLVEFSGEYNKESPIVTNVA